MSLPYYRKFPKDFWGDARVEHGMSRLARLTYNAMLDVAWQLGPLKSPQTVVESLCGDSSLWEEIRQCWTETPDGWIQTHLEEERAHAQKRCDIAKRAVKAREARRPKGERGVHPSSDDHRTIIERSSDDASDDDRTIIGRSSNQNQNQNQSQSQSHTQNQLPPLPPPGGESDFWRLDWARRPSDSEVKAAVRRHPELQVLQGLPEAILRWRAVLPSSKSWKSLGAVERRLRTIVEHSSDALAIVQLCTEEEWSDPQAAVDTLAKRKLGRAPSGLSQEERDRRCAPSERGRYLG